MVRKPKSPQEVQQIFDLRAQGYSYAKIAKELKMSRETIGQYIRSKGEPRKNAIRTENKSTTTVEPYKCTGCHRLVNLRPCKICEALAAKKR